MYTSGMLRIARIVRRRSSNELKPRDDIKGDLPSKFLKDLTKKKNLKQVVVEKRKSNFILDSGWMFKIQAQFSVWDYFNIKI